MGTTQLCNFYIGLENQPKKINQIKSPLSMPLTTQLCNFYIGLENQPKKINKKNQNKITHIYAPYYTIMQLLHWTGESTQKNQPKKIKIKSPLLHNYATFTLDWRINQKKSTKKNQNKITFIYAPYYIIMQLQNWTEEST